MDLDPLGEAGWISGNEQSDFNVSYMNFASSFSASVAAGLYPPCSSSSSSTNYYYLQQALEEQTCALLGQQEEANSTAAAIVCSEEPSLPSPEFTDSFFNPGSSSRADSGNFSQKFACDQKTLSPIQVPSACNVRNDAEAVRR
jgi:hypothetical protein